jgi:hypothetical protein
MIDHNNKARNTNMPAVSNTPSAGSIKQPKGCHGASRDHIAAPSMIERIIPPLLE